MLAQLAARPLLHAPIAPIALRHAAPIALDPSVALYELQLSAEALVSDNLQTLTPASALALYGAGLLTSLTPCCLSMLPLTVAFFASGADGEGSRRSTIVPANDSTTS